MTKQALHPPEIDVLEEAGGVGIGERRLVPLSLAPVGARVRIRYLGEASLRAQAIRLGLGPGAEVTVWARLPGGPVLLTRGSQKLAVGRALADNAWVEIVTGHAAPPRT